MEKYTYNHTKHPIDERRLDIRKRAIKTDMLRIYNMIRFCKYFTAIVYFNFRRRHNTPASSVIMYFWIFFFICCCLNSFFPSPALYIYHSLSLNLSPVSVSMFALRTKRLRIEKKLHFHHLNILPFRFNP